MASNYAPNTDQEAAVTHTPDDRLLIGGDFNLVFDNDIDPSAHRFGQMGALSAAGLRFLSHVGLLDLWRTRFPTTRDYTFFSSAHKTWARLDYFLGSQSVMAAVLDVSIHPSVHSDHAHISITLFLPPVSLRLKSWKLRDSLKIPNIEIPSVCR